MPYYPPGTGGASDHGALTGLADDDHTAYATNAEFDDHSARHEDGGADEISIAGLAGTPTAVTDHLNDATDAHDASAISIVDAGTLITATEVEGALQEIAGASASAHIADATDAHDASAVSFDDTGLTITAADVQTMGEQLDAAISAGGIPATIFDAVGDIIVASAADTAARLAIGAAGGALSRVNGAVAWNSGTAMPTAATGDRFWRTDLGLEFYYDGTRWLTTTLFRLELRTIDTDISAAAQVVNATPGSTSLNLWLVRYDISIRVDTTNSGSHFWTTSLRQLNAANGVEVTSAAPTTAAIAADTTTIISTAIGAAMDTDCVVFDVLIGKTGTPGDLTYLGAALFYRYIGT